MAILRKLWTHMQSTEVRLWHLLLGFVVTTIIGLYSNSNQKHQDLVVQRSQELVSVSSEFENRVSGLIRSGDSFEKLRADQLALLSTNLEQQIAALNKIRPSLANADQRKTADEYAETLVKLRDIIDGGLKPESTNAFGTAAQKLVTTRDLLLRSLS